MDADQQNGFTKWKKPTQTSKILKDVWIDNTKLKWKQVLYFWKV